jgi:D-glycero-D-manno-heptose 1,7-bisphosphate phosphatase
MTEPALRPAAFLDRDGVLNVDVGYAHRPDQIEWVAGAPEAVRRLNEAGFRVFVVTNQAGIARGLYGETDVSALMAWMVDRLGEMGGRIDGWRASPYHPEFQAERFAHLSHWRKPEPGMLLDLMSEWPTERQGSFIIGDRASDLDAGRRAGISGYLFKGGNLDAFVRDVLRDILK